MTYKRAICVLEILGDGLKLVNEKDKEPACIIAIKAISKVMDLKMDLQNEIHRLENQAIDEATSDEEKIKVLVALECYSKVLNQIDQSRN